MSKLWSYNTARNNSWESSSSRERVSAVFWFIATVAVFAGIGVLLALGI